MVLPFFLIGASFIIKKIFVAPTVTEQIGMTSPEPEPDRPIVISGRSLNDIVGRYKNLDICRYVKADDGRNFIFESIAIEHVPGTYFSDDPSQNYIVVDKLLLYREVPADLG